MQRSESLALAEALVAISLWAISFIYIKLALREVSPVTLIVLRFGMGALVLGTLAWLRGDLARLRRADLAPIALLGAVGITLHQLLQVTGQATAEASVAAVLAATAPAFTVGLAAATLREPLRAWQVAGIALATLGAGVVATGGEVGALLRGRLGTPGNGLVLLSAVVWAIFTILNKRVVHGRPSVGVTAGMFLFGGLFTLPLFVARRGWHELPGLSPAGWGAVLAVGLLCTVVAYLLNSHALKHLAASRVAAIQNVEPVVAVAAAALILGEAITPAMLGGGLAIVVGVYLAERRGFSAAWRRLAVGRARLRTLLDRGPRPTTGRGQGRQAAPSSDA